MIDVVVTSWRRYGFLTETLESLMRVCGKNIRKVYVREDGKMPSEVISDISYIDPKIEVYDGEHIGQVASLDFLMNLVQTEYYLGLEDDWRCMANGIEEGIDILHNPKVASVSLRGNSIKSHNGQSTVLENGLYVFEEYRKWTGWSYAPSMRRKRDYVPYSSLTEFDQNRPWEAEKEIGIKLSKEKINVTTEKEYFLHIGATQSTVNFQV